MDFLAGHGEAVKSILRVEKEDMTGEWAVQGISGVEQGSKDDDQRQWKTL